MEVDIGYMEQMELRSTCSSLHLHREKRGQDPTPQNCEDPAENLQWVEEISEKEAFDLLEKKMYPFKEVSVSGRLVRQLQ